MDEINLTKALEVHMSFSISPVTPPNVAGENRSMVPSGKGSADLATPYSKVSTIFYTKHLSVLSLQWEQPLNTPTIWLTTAQPLTSEEVSSLEPCLNTPLLPCGSYSPELTPLAEATLGAKIKYLMRKNSFSLKGV